MDTIKYIKKSPQCGPEIDPRQIETTWLKLFLGCIRLCVSVYGLGMEAPAHPVSRCAFWYYESTILNENKRTHNKWFTLPNSGQ